MIDPTFLTDIAVSPQDQAHPRAEVGFARLREAARAAGEGDFMARLLDHPAAAALLARVFAHSPFLGHCLIVDPRFTRCLFENGPAIAVERLIGETGAMVEIGDERLMSALRRVRRRLALAVALADIAGAWPLETVTDALSRFADAAVGAAIAHLLRAAATAGLIAIDDPDNPAVGSGLIVLGLGKLGAGELNYSSDIDIIVLYDPDVATVTGKRSAQEVFVRLTRNLVRLLQTRTADGHVFRTDLRLRPDPGATPVAISTVAAETYYESLGQNWERAAMIKARQIAGDAAAGSAFLDTLRPFVWRRNLDFATIQDIHSIKRQINAHFGGGEIAVRGHNLKLGRGGIREIEFFAQTQQLIWGGRDPTLGARATRDALDALAAAGRIAPEVARELGESYRFLRRVEHRLQMIDDRQTHSLPEDEAAFDDLADFLGYPSGAAFAAATRAVLMTVERRYGELFEEAPPLAPSGNLVFTGADDDPGTLATLAALGYADGPAVGAIVRGWHHGRYRALRSTRARQILTELMPTLLAAFAKTSEPDAALARFDAFLARLPAGIQLFAMIHANPGLLDLVAEIMGTAPSLAETLGRNVGLLDAVLSPDFLDPLPDTRALTALLDAHLAMARDYEDLLDNARRAAHDHAFRIGVQCLQGQIAPDLAGAALADLADAVLTSLAPRVAKAFADRHGTPPGAGLAIIGMGNLGGREMTVSSDLDLLFIYAADDLDAVSDGARPLPVSQYFTRLGQWLINALSALTAAGRLYRIDMRLRPSGKSGPVASAVESFLAYQRDEAWTWEHMALTRARVIAGPPALVARLNEGIRQVLARPRDPERLRADVADMRRRIAAEHPGDNPWRTKHARGGLVDIEFIAQYLQLRVAADRPDVPSPNTLDALHRLGAAGALAPEDAASLIAAARLMRRLRGILRLTVGGDRVEDHASDGLRRRVAHACDQADFESLRRALLQAQAEVRRLYAAIVERRGPPIKRTKNGPSR